VLCAHRNYLAHFDHIAAHLTDRLGWKCIFVSEHADREPAGVTHVSYMPLPGGTGQSHYFSRTFENAIAPVGDPATLSRDGRRFPGP